MLVCSGIIEKSTFLYMGLFFGYVGQVITCYMLKYQIQTVSTTNAITIGNPNWNCILNFLDKLITLCRVKQSLNQYLPFPWSIIKSLLCSNLCYHMTTAFKQYVNSDNLYFQKFHIQHDTMNFFVVIVSAWSWLIHKMHLKYL